MKWTALSAVIAGALLFALPVQAQTVTGLYNTGVNSSGVKLGEGAQDPHYTVNGGAPTFVYNNPNYLTDPSANFISASQDGVAPGSQFTYSLTFNLSGINPAMAQLSGAFAADNAGSVSLNGLVIANNFAQYNQPAAFQSLTQFVATGLLSGTNVLTFFVQDAGPPSALLVTNLTVTAVPGPIAGTGAVALIALSGAFFMRRRAQTA